MVCRSRSADFISIATPSSVYLCGVNFSLTSDELDPSRLVYLPGQGMHPFLPMMPGHPMALGEGVYNLGGFHPHELSNLPFLSFHENFAMPGLRLHGNPPVPLMPGTHTFADSLGNTNREQDLNASMLEGLGMLPGTNFPGFPFPSSGTKLDADNLGLGFLSQYPLSMVDSTHPPLPVHNLGIHRNQTDSGQLLSSPLISPMHMFSNREESTPNIPPVNFLTQPPPTFSSTVVPPISVLPRSQTPHSQGPPQPGQQQPPPHSIAKQDIPLAHIKNEITDHDYFQEQQKSKQDQQHKNQQLQHNKLQQIHDDSEPKSNSTQLDQQELSVLTFLQDSAGEAQGLPFPPHEWQQNHLLQQQLQLQMQQIQVQHRLLLQQEQQGPQQLEQDEGQDLQQLQDMQRLQLQQQFTFPFPENVEHLSERDQLLLYQPQALQHLSQESIPEERPTSQQ
eukprot:TRINITY_DN6760_c0_g1_i1.p1 TRINITY_DN6760_c0_g1~~TRINITY_DN6760_c0_g1_i1.p1  ORF type:complete len:449 (-),score=91.04 TRINITY_DN6760_c0_g1_i1:192-1538(-)